MIRLIALAAASLASIVVSESAARAQLNTQHIKDVVGLKAGTQAPPHWYIIGPLIYSYDTDTVRDRDGNGVGPAGLSYYTMFKLADDHIDGVPGFLVRGRNTVFALGPEGRWCMAQDWTRSPPTHRLVTE